MVRQTQQTLRLAPRVRDLDEAREAIGAYVIHYHHRPHSRLDYNTPLEVAATWKDGQDHLTQAAYTVNTSGEHVRSGGGARGG